MIRIFIGSVITLFSGLMIIPHIFMTYEAMVAQKPYANHLGGVLVSSLFLLFGLLMIRKGRNRRKKVRLIKEYALKKQSESGSVNAFEVSEHTGFNMIEVSKVVNKLERNGLITIVTGNAAETESNRAEKTGDKKKQLKCLLDENLITKEEYEAKCKELTGSFANTGKPETSRVQETGAGANSKNIIVVDRKMNVDQLIELISEKMNIGVRIYNGRKFAKGDSLLEEIGYVEENPVEISVSRQRKVGNFEKYFKQITGLNIQVENKNGKLADNNLSLGQVS